jgi:cbb3-type cytochrome c oxidase subunit III
MAKWIDGRRLRRGASLSLACLAAGLVTAGCGSSASSDKSRPTRTVVQVQHVARDRWTYARERFREACGGCHTLADAGTHGRRFNLDHDAKIDENRARYAIAEGEPGMPAWGGVLSKREYEELVAYLVAVQKPTPGNDNWHWQFMLRARGEDWSPEDTQRLEDEFTRESEKAAGGSGARGSTAGGSTPSGTTTSGAGR